MAYDYLTGILKKVAQALDGAKANKSGDTFTGDLTLSAGSGERRINFATTLYLLGFYGTNYGEFGAIDRTNSRYIWQYKAHANTFTISAALVLTPAASVTPTNNGDLMVQLTSNTQLTFKVKGSDGTVRSANLTLA